MVKPIVYKILHWITLFTKFVTVTLVIFQQNFLKDKLWLSASSMAGISCLLLGISCIIGISKKCRENTPPIVVSLINTLLFCIP